MPQPGTEFTTYIVGEERAARVIPSLSPRPPGRKDAGMTHDAIIIGAGVIGAATAFELAKLGYRTLTVDANAEAGHGSTSGSCAVIRVHYSTVEGTALAWEAYHYWRDWPEYLETADERGLARFLEMGCLVMKTDQNGQMARHTAICTDLGIPWEDWDADRLTARLPHYRLDRYAPAKRPEDDGFAEPTGGELAGAIWFPTAGYVNDPALSAHNLQRAAEAKGAEFRFNARVTGILTEGGRAAGVRLSDGNEFHAPGGRERGRPRLRPHQRNGGRHR